MAEVSKIQTFAIDILIGIGFGVLIAVALIFARHNPILAISISIVYTLIQVKSFWKLFQHKMYVGMVGRFIFSICFACILGALIWGVFFLGNSIDNVDKGLFVTIISTTLLLSIIYAICKNFFHENPTYKKIELMIAGLSAISVLDKE